MLCTLYRDSRTRSVYCLYQISGFKAHGLRNRFALMSEGTGIHLVEIRLPRTKRSKSPHPHIKLRGDCGLGSRKLETKQQQRHREPARARIPRKSSPRRMPNTEIGRAIKHPSAVGALGLLFLAATDHHRPVFFFPCPRGNTRIVHSCVCTKKNPTKPTQNTKKKKKTLI